VLVFEGRGLGIRPYNLNTKVGWKVDSNHRKVGYGLIGNLGNALQGKFAWGYKIPFQA